jgi:hypothetical protein
MIALQCVVDARAPLLFNRVDFLSDIDEKQG